MKWEQVERLSKVGYHDEEWLIESECGKYEAVGHYSCGELVSVTEIKETK